MPFLNALSKSMKIGHVKDTRGMLSENLVDGLKLLAENLTQLTKNIHTTLKSLLCDPESPCRIFFADGQDCEILNTDQLLMGMGNIGPFTVSSVTCTDS